MTRNALLTRLTRFRQDDSGAMLVEFALVMPIFLLLFFGLIDFGRLGFSYVMAQKATERAVREAVVTSPVCSGLPATNVRGSFVGTSTQYKFGASCNAATGLCATAATVTCTASTANAQSDAIWAKVSPLMPSNATRANLVFEYRFDPQMGFLGGPYTPRVTVEIRNLNFEFVTPIGGLAAMMGAANASQVGADFAFPSMSASLPAEALKRGDS